MLTGTAKAVAASRLEEVRRRYATLFGSGMEWQTTGMDGWLDAQQAVRPQT